MEYYRKKLMRRATTLLVAIAALAAGCGDDGAGGRTSAGAPTAAGGGEVILATTTSVEDPGLLDELLPAFGDETGIDVKPVAVGSGAAIELGRTGEADVVIAHSPDAVAEWVAEGGAGEPRIVMHNDFVVVGPADDPAGVGAATSPEDAMERIAAAEAPFVSRGDDSGTHTFELDLWESAGIDPAGAWYTESGQGMGETIQIAAEREAYTISDSSTHLATAASSGLEVAYGGDPAMLNVYEVIPATAAAGDRVNAEGAQAFADFLVGDEAQSIIAEFGADRYGEPLFAADAGQTLGEVRAEVG